MTGETMRELLEPLIGKFGSVSMLVSRIGPVAWSMADDKKLTGVEVRSDGLAAQPRPGGRHPQPTRRECHPRAGYSRCDLERRTRPAAIRWHQDSQSTATHSCAHASYSARDATLTRSFHGLAGRRREWRVWLNDSSFPMTWRGRPWKRDAATGSPNCQPWWRESPTAGSSRWAIPSFPAAQPRGWLQPAMMPATTSYSRSAGRTRRLDTKRTAFGRGAEPERYAFTGPTSCRRRQCFSSSGAGRGRN
jgi:hypothetical protein